MAVWGELDLPAIQLGFALWLLAFLAIGARGASVVAAGLAASTSPFAAGRAAIVVASLTSIASAAGTFLFTAAMLTSEAFEAILGIGFARPSWAEA